MGKMDEIVEMLKDCGCDTVSINETIDDLLAVTKGKGELQVGIAVAIYLKILARQLCDDNDADTNLAVLLDLADAYNVGIHSK